MGNEITSDKVSDITTKELRNAINVQIIDEMNDMCLQFQTTKYKPSTSTFGFDARMMNQGLKRNATISASQLVGSVSLGSLISDWNLLGNGDDR